MISTINLGIALTLFIMIIIIFIKYQYKSSEAFQEKSIEQIANKVPSLRNWLTETEKGVKQLTEFDIAANTPLPNYSIPGYSRVGAYA